MEETTQADPASVGKVAEGEDEALPGEDEEKPARCYNLKNVYLMNCHDKHSKMVNKQFVKAYGSSE